MPDTPGNPVDSSPSVPLDPDALFGPDQPCFGCGPRHPIGLRLKFQREGNQVVTRFVPGENYQGPPGIMHGGLVMTAADELADYVILGLKERFGFTTSFDVRLSRPIRTGQEVFGRGWISKDSSRIIRVQVELSQGGQVAASGEIAFAILDAQAAAKLLGKDIPEHWKRFCR
jgi:acyl-coenzyme A thioesterase PaaI-like protein